MLTPSPASSVTGSPHGERASIDPSSCLMTARGTPLGAIQATAGSVGVVPVGELVELSVAGAEVLGRVATTEVDVDVAAEQAAKTRQTTPNNALEGVALGKGEASNVEFMPIAQLLRSPVVQRATIAIIAAIAVLAYPDLVGSLLFELLALVAVAVGAVEIFGALRTRAVRGILNGLAFVVFGVVLLLGGELANRAVELALAGVLAWRGGLNLVFAYRSRAVGEDPFWPVSRGVLLILLAAALLVIPDSLLLWVVLLVAVTWIVSGVIVIVNAIGEDEANAVPDDVVTVIRQKSMPAQLRQMVSESIFDGIDNHEGGVQFAALMSFATAIATFGIKSDSTAVVIGAMLIAPLMTPIMALSASILMGWGRRALLSGRRVGIGVAIGIGGSWLMSLMSPEFVSIANNSQVASRTSPTLLDLLIALAAGAAGGYAVTHPKVGNSLPGVAIAVALAPPLAVVGYSLEQGEVVLALGAFLLFATNLVGIVVAAGITYVVSGYSPWTRIEQGGDQSRRSLALVGISLLLVAIPLGIIGEGIIHQTTARSSATETVERWLGPESPYEIVRLRIAGEEVEVFLIGSGDLPAEPADLANELAQALRTDVVLTLDVTPRDSTVTEGSYAGRR